MPSYPELRLNNENLLSDRFYIALPEHEDSFSIESRPRIGVEYAKEWAEKLLRFYIKGNAYISKA